VADGPRIVRFDEQDTVDADAVVAFWLRERALPLEVARRRVDELHHVALAGGEVVGVSSIYLAHSTQLRLPMWHYRVFVGAAHRRGLLAATMARAGRDDLLDRFVSGRDTRATGIVYEVESEVLQRGVPDAVWPKTGFTFIGENERGDHVRVFWFPGAVAPPPPTAQGST
jgi:hypothetical protein